MLSDFEENFKESPEERAGTFPLYLPLASGIYGPLRDCCQAVPDRLDAAGRRSAG